MCVPLILSVHISSMADVIEAEQSAQATKRPLPAELHDEVEGGGDENTKKKKYRLTELAKKYGKGVNLVRFLWLWLLRSYVKL